MSLTATIIVTTLILLAFSAMSFYFFSLLRDESIENASYDRARDFEHFAVMMIRKGNASEVVVPRSVSIRSLKKVMAGNSRFVIAEDEQYRKVIRLAEKES